MQERDARIAGVGPEERRADRLGQPETDGAPDERAEKVRHFGLAQTGFDADDDEAEQRADQHVHEHVRRERPNEHGGVGDRDDEQHTDDQMPGHG